MIRIIVTGAAGRMGQRIIANLCVDKNFKLVGAIENPKSPALGKDAGLVAGCGECAVKITDSLEKVVSLGDVVIDFTAATTTLPHLEIAALHKKAVVIGSTGHTPEQRVSIESMAKKIPIVMASNMSVGINVMWKLLADAAKILGSGFDIEIVEAHHRLKKDAPSGTAITTAEILAKALGRKVGIQSIRGGDVVGDHTVFFLGNGERLEVTHRASSRDTFAVGAIRAAKWLFGKPHGLYSMADVLGLKVF